MSLDRSLKSKAALSRHRNVLTRAERIRMLAEEDRWNEHMSILGLPKVVHRKVVVGGKKKKEKKGEQAEAGAAEAGKSP